VDLQKPATVLHYWQRAYSFYGAARALAELDDDPPAYAQAIGLLAVHACIALADAVLVGVGERQAKPEDHGEAARRLHGYCTAKKVEDAGLKHFEWLLGKKTLFSYGQRGVDEMELLVAKTKMEQFFAWASRAFPEVARL